MVWAVPLAQRHGSLAQSGKFPYRYTLLSLRIESETLTRRL